jgi:hypothetical protein
LDDPKGLEMMSRMIQITVRCQDHPQKHAKILRLNPGAGMGTAETLAALLDGTSSLYFFPPGEQSPIGRCCVCGGKVKSEVGEVEINGENWRGCRE